MPPTNFLSQIQQLGKEIIPVDGHLYLYGSRARGDYNPNSDWEIMVAKAKELVSIIEGLLHV